MVSGMQPIGPKTGVTSSEPLPSSLSNAKSHLLESLPFASPSQVTSKQLAEKAQCLDDKLGEELQGVLEQRETFINEELANLAQTAKDQAMIRALIDVEKWAYEYADTTKDIVKTGIGFLESVLPRHLLEGPIPNAFADVSQLVSLSGTFLSALDSGASGLAMILKSKILEQSKAALSKLKADYAEQLLSLELKTGVEDWESHLKSAHKQLSHKELKKLKKVIQELEIKVKIEEKGILHQQTKLRISALKKTISILKIPLKLLPIDRTLAFFTILSHSLSWTTTVLGITLASFSLRQSTKNWIIYQKWAAGFEEWKQRQQHVINKDDSNLALVASQTNPIEPSLSQAKDMPGVSQKDDEGYLLRLFHRHRTLDEIRIKLRDFGFELDSTTQTLEELLEKFHQDSAFRQKLVSAYADFQRIFENFDYIIQTSQDLLTKRKAQVEKKIFMLRPHLPDLMPKIATLKQNHFQNLWQQLRVDAALKTNAQQPAVSEECLQRQVEELGLPFSIKQFSDRSQMIQALDHLKENQFDTLFEKWMAAQSPENLLRFYVDHQETLEITTKNALKEMVTKKQALEGGFLKFNLLESRTFFTATVLSSAVTVALAIIGLIGLPFGGAGLIFLCLSLASVSLTVGFIGAGYYYAHCQKPSATTLVFKGIHSSLLFTNLRASIQEYAHTSKKKKLQETAQILQLLHNQPLRDKDSSEYQVAFKRYEAAKKAFGISQSKVEKWKQKLKDLKHKLRQAEWQDFARQASLKVQEDPHAFDTLRAFSQAFQKSDLTLLSSETQALLEVQLGLNVKALQQEIEKSPEAIKKALQKFFTLDDAAFVQFIHYQEERLKRGMIAQPN